jgi:hypothetical protein
VNDDVRLAQQAVTTVGGPAHLQPPRIHGSRISPRCQLSSRGTGPPRPASPATPPASTSRAVWSAICFCRAATCSALPARPPPCGVASDGLGTGGPGWAAGSGSGWAAVGGAVVLAGWDTGVSPFRVGVPGGVAPPPASGQGSAPYPGARAAGLPGQGQNRIATERMEWMEWVELSRGAGPAPGRTSGRMSGWVRRRRWPAVRARRDRDVAFLESRGLADRGHRPAVRSEPDGRGTSLDPGSAVHPPTAPPVMLRPSVLLVLGHGSGSWSSLPVSAGLNTCIHSPS